MKLKHLIAAGLLCGSSFALAQNYQFEVGGGLTHVDPDNGKSDTQVGAYGRYHFTRVQTAQRPLAEAAFLARSSNAYVRGYDDLDVIQGGAEFYIPDTIFYVAAEVTRTDYPGQRRNNDWGVRLGVTPIEGLLLWTGYYDEPGYDLNLHGKYVLDLGHNNAVNVEAGFTDTDDDNHIYLIGDFYFDRTFSAGVGYIDNGDDGFLIRTRKFFTESISVEASYTKSDYLDQFSVGASFRF